MLTTHFPRIRTTQPIVRNFVLPALLNGLLEHTILVAEPITHGRNFHRSHRIEETCRQSPKPSVAQSSVGLLIKYLVPIDLLLLNVLLDNVIKKKIRNVVSQRTTDEEFHRKVVNTLGILAIIGFLCSNPSLRKDITHGVREGFKTFAVTDRHGIHHVIKDEMALIKSVVRSRKLNRSATVPLNEFR